MSKKCVFYSFSEAGKLQAGKAGKAGKQQEKQKTEKCKRWVHACGRRDFILSQIKKDTYICSIHFVGENEPTGINPDPIMATSSKVLISSRKAPKERDKALSFEATKKT